MEGKLVVISGFSGAGKGTVISRLREQNKGYVLSVSMTTRQPREGETDGVEYHFVNNEVFEELSRYFKLDRASKSHGGMLKIRIRMTAKDRAELSATAELIGAEDLLTKDTAHNKGENFERELTERWTAETWVKDSVPFNVAGDIVVNGENVQVKLDGAELTNEKILARLVA